MMPLRCVDRNSRAFDRYLCARGVRALSHLDAVICISREAESDLHFYWNEFGLKPTPTRVILWPVPFPGEAPMLPSNFSAKRILYVARLEPHKNHLRLLEACEKLWSEGLSFELRLIGCLAYPGAARKILRRVRSLQAAGRPIQWQGACQRSRTSRGLSGLFIHRVSVAAGGVWSAHHREPLVRTPCHLRNQWRAGRGRRGRRLRAGRNRKRGKHGRQPATAPDRRESIQSTLRGNLQRSFRTWKDYWKDASDWLGTSS